MDIGSHSQNRTESILKNKKTNTNKKIPMCEKRKKENGKEDKRTTPLPSLEIFFPHRCAGTPMFLFPFFFFFFFFFENFWMCRMTNCIMTNGKKTGGTLKNGAFLHFPRHITPLSEQFTQERKKKKKEEKTRWAHLPFSFSPLSFYLFVGGERKLRDPPNLTKLFAPPNPSQNLVRKFERKT